MRSLRLIICLCFCSCGLLRNSSKFSSDAAYNKLDQSEFSASKEKEASFELNMSGYSTDSVTQSYQVQIWPKGSFSFSKDLGFVGEAEVVRIKGNTQSLVKQVEVISSREKKKETEALDDRKIKKEQIKQEWEMKESTPSWKWILASFILVIVLIWWIKKK